MKKLFALVLSLALVVAFAVPALATGWATLETAPVYKDLSIAVYGLNTYANTSKVGTLYEELSASYPLVEGTDVHFLVELTVPYGNLTPAVQKLIKNVGLDVEIALSNLKISKDVVTNVPDGVETKDDCITKTFWNPDYAAKTVVWTWEVWAKAKAAKEGKVVATAGFYNKWDGQQMKIYNAKGKLAYTVSHTDDLSKFFVSNGDATVAFPVSNDKINKNGIKINYEETDYVIAVGSHANGSVDFLNNDTWVAAGSLYNTLLENYKDIFGFLGFEYADCDYMTREHYTKFFSLIGEVSASYVWSAGSVVVAPVTPELPQTGDNASIVGFAMIAVAMIAAAVVTVKKVRA